MDSTGCNHLTNKIFWDLLTPSLLFWISCRRNSSKISVNFVSLFLMIKSCYFKLISSNFGWFNKKVVVEATYFILNWCKWPERRCTKNIRPAQNVQGGKYDFNLDPSVFVLLKCEHFKHNEKCEIFEEENIFRTQIENQIWCLSPYPEPTKAWIKYVLIPIFTSQKIHTIIFWI